MEGRTSAASEGTPFAVAHLRSADSYSRLAAAAAAAFSDTAAALSDTTGAVDDPVFPLVAIATAAYWRKLPPCASDGA